MLKKIKIITTSLCLAVGISFLVKANLSANSTIPYKDSYGTKCINILDLAKTLNGDIEENILNSSGIFENSLYMFFNNKTVVIYPKADYMYIDGEIVPYATEKVLDSISNVEFNFPMKANPVKDGDGYLVPVSIIEEHFNIKGTDKGLENLEEHLSDNNTENGLTPIEVEKRLLGLGLKFENDRSGYGVSVYSTNGIDLAIREDSRITLALYDKNPINLSITKKVLSLALPTSWEEVYSDITNTFSSKTIERDGKTIEFKDYEDAPTIVIQYED